MAASSGNSNKVQVVIEAKDVATEVVKKTGISFNNLNKEATVLSKSLTGTGQALQFVINYADLTRVKLTDTSVAIIGLGVATTGALGGAVAKLIGLTSVIGKIKEGIQSPIGQTFIGQIQQSAENATKELAPLSTLLKEVSSVGAGVGAGFGQKLFNLDTRTISQQLDDGITLGVGRIGDKILTPLKNALGTFDNEGLKVVGKIAQRLDRELSRSIVDATFGLAIGKGATQEIIKGIATNPAIAQYSPVFLKSLLSGSTAGAVDNLLLGISQQIKSSQFKPIGDFLGQSGLQNQIEVLANLKVETTSGFAKLDAQIANFVIDQRIGQVLGKNVSTGLIKSILQNSAVKGVLSSSIQDLLNGSFSDALLKVTQRGISAPLGNLFNLANTSVENLAYNSGVRLANRLFDGLDPEIKKRNQRSREILGDTFNGVGAKFTAGLGLGTSNLPLLSSSRGGLLSGILNDQIKNLITSFVPVPGVVVDQLLDFDGIIQQLFKATGLKGQIPGLKQLDAILGKAVAASLGKAIDTQLPVLLAPLVDNAANYVTKRFKDAGSNAIASAATAFLPGYLKNVVKTSLLESGAAGFVFDALLENLKPANLKSNFAALDGVLGNLKTNVNAGLKLTDTLLRGFKSGVAEIPNILGNTQSLINSLVTSADVGLAGLKVDAIDFVLNFNYGIDQISANIVNTLLDASIALQSLRGTTVGDNIIDALQEGIQKAIQAVGFLQAKIKAIANASLGFTIGGIDNVRNFLQGFNNFSQNIIPNIKSGITSVFNTVNSGIAIANRNIQSLLISASRGIDSIKSAIPSIVAQIASSISSLRTSLGQGFTNIDTFLNSLQTSTSFGTTFATQIQFVRDRFTDLKLIADASLSFIQTKVASSSGLFIDFGNKLQGAIAAVSAFSSGTARNIQSGLSAGLRNTINAIDTVVPSAVRTLTGLINSALVGIGANGRGGFGKFFNEAIDSARAIVTKLTPIFNTVVTSLETTFGNVVNFIRKTFGSIAGVVATNLGKIIGNILKVDLNFTELPPGLGEKINSLFGGVFSSLFGRIGQNANRAFLAGFFGAGFERVSPAIDAIDKSAIRIYNTLSTLPSKIAAPLNTIAQFPGAIAGFNEPLKVFGYLQDTIAGFANGVSSVVERVAFFSQGLSSLQQFATTGPFKTLIGQNIELREQLLSTQSSLVATSKIYSGFTGQQITDPKTAIQSLEDPIKTAIDKLRIESLDLVGVTSKDLVPLYQQIAGQITGIGGKLTDAKDLSLDFAASLGTLQIPLYQSRQEIGSILSGTIDQNSVLAKSLNISNEQVNNWKSQGRLVEELRKKLAPFRAGNALAAASFSGVISNIQEVFDEIGRRAGERLLDPLIEQVTSVYDYLKANQEQFVSYFGLISDQILRVGLAVVDAGKTVFSSISGLIAEAPLYLFKSLANAAEALAGAIRFVAEALGPTIRFMTELVKAAGPLGGVFLQSFVTVKALSVGVTTLGDVFGTLTQLVPGLGEVMFALDLRTNGVANQFINLSKVLGTGGGGFLILGKYLNEIPGAAEAATVALGPLGGLLVGFIPTVASVGIQVAGLITLFPAIGAFLSNLLTLTPALITAAGAFVSSNIYLAPLAPLFTQAANAVGLYANATDRVLLVNQQFAAVLKNIGTAIAGQILTFGLLAGGAYLAFLAFDKFVLQNETVKEILYGVIQGLGSLADMVKIAFGNPFAVATAAVVGLTVAINLGLIPSVSKLIATTLAGWAVNLAGILGGLATTLSALGFVGVAASASSAAVGVRALSIAMTQGTVASAQFLATNGITITSLFGLTAATGGATVGLATFATALYTAIAPLLLLAAPLIALAAAIGLIGIGLYSLQLKDANEATEILGDRTAKLSEQAIKTASDLKKASDIQADADKRGVRLSDEQYKANQKLVAQAKNQKADLSAQLADLQDQLKNVRGEANKANIQSQIDELNARIKLIDSFVGNIKIKPKDLERVGSGYEQLAKQAQGAEEAILKSSGDSAIFKQKAEELLAATEKQAEAGQISADEAIRRYNLVATNAFASQELQDKAQQAITAAFKRESDKRIGIVQAQQAAISAQLAVGKVEYEENAKAISDAQNSLLKSRLDAENEAHQTKLKQIQKEFDDQTFVNNALLKQKQDEATKLSAQGQDASAPLAEAEKLKAKIIQIEQDKNAALNSENTRNARITSELSSQIAENEISANLVAADLRIKVNKGIISQELAAEKQLTFAKKVELETQLRNTNDNYAERRKIIERDFANTTKYLEDEIAKKQSEASKAPTDSPAAKAAEADIAALNTKLVNSNKAKNSSLLLLEQNYKTEVTKINADIQKNQAESADRESAIQIKILERNQKKALDAVQLAQNERLIQIQQLENKGLLDHTEVEEKKTQASKANIDAQLNQERLRLKSLQALPKPKNQEKAADFDASIRASQLKIQDLVKQSLSAELSLYKQHIEVIKAQIKDEDSIRETQLESQARKGLVTQAQVNEELARRKVSALEKEYNLETRDASKRIELALAIEKAKTALLDAEIRTRQEKLEVENQKLKNQIDEQNQSIKRQGDLYQILTKAIEQRNKLLEISRDLAKAGTDFVLGELEVLSSVERSEYRRKQLAEVTASIKLQSLRQQQKYERQSLLNQIEQNKLALEQEAIQNRINQGQKLADIAGVKADIAVLEADPRNQSVAGQAKIKALQIKLQSELDALGFLQLEGGLIGQKFQGQQTQAQAQLQQLDLKQNLDTLKARAELANALPPGKQQQAQRQLQQEIAQSFGQQNIREFYNAAIAQSRGIAAKEFPISSTPDILAAISPDLGGILDMVGGQAATAAITDVSRTFDKQYGSTANITGALTTGIAKTPLQTPLEVQRSQSLNQQILQQANQPISLTSGASLKLPPPNERGVTLSLESSGKLFKEGVDKLVDYLKQPFNNSNNTYNIKIDAPAQNITATGNGSTSSLEKVLDYAKQMAGAY